MSHPPGTVDRVIQEVSRRPGGWSLRVAGDCTPVFVAEEAAGHPPAAGDRLRTYPDGRRTVVREAVRE